LHENLFRRRHRSGKVPTLPFVRAARGCSNRRRASTGVRSRERWEERGYARERRHRRERRCAAPSENY
jgi:hypothetical protein